jgi:hypothetical protein
MPEILDLILMILVVGWLIDRGWSLLEKCSSSTNSLPLSQDPPREISQKPKQAIPQNPSITLRKDWLRLGRRSK